MADSRAGPPPPRTDHSLCIILIPKSIFSYKARLGLPAGRNPVCSLYCLEPVPIAMIRGIAPIVTSPAASRQDVSAGRRLRLRQGFPIFRGRAPPPPPPPPNVPLTAPHPL